MSELDPSLKLNYGDGEHMELTADNTTLFTFLGRTAVGNVMLENSAVNHAFIKTGENKNGQPTGIYFFEAFHPVYKDISQFAIKHSFPIIGNSRQITAGDLQVYYTMLDQEQAKFAAELPDELPEDFK